MRSPGAQIKHRAASGVSELRHAGPGERGRAMGGRRARSRPTETAEELLAPLDAEERGTLRRLLRKLAGVET
jgi:hypothetical protein